MSPKCYPYHIMLKTWICLLIVLGYIFVYSLLDCLLLTLMRYHKDQNNITYILSCLIKICYVLLYLLIPWYGIFFGYNY